MTPGLLSDWWGKYLTLCFAEGGRDWKTGLDCWGLVQFVLHRECGIKLPLHDVISSEDVEQVVRAIDAAVTGPKGPWKPVEHGFEQPFDVARIARPAKVNGSYVKLPWHVGIVTRPGHLLHMDLPTGVIEVAFRDGVTFSHHYSMPPRDVSLYRHRALCAVVAA